MLLSGTQLAVRGLPTWTTISHGPWLFVSARDAALTVSKDKPLSTLWSVMPTYRIGVNNPVSSFPRDTRNHAGVDTPGNAWYDRAPLIENINYRFKLDCPRIAVSTPYITLTNILVSVMCSIHSFSVDIYSPYYVAIEFWHWSPSMRYWIWYGVMIPTCGIGNLALAIKPARLMTWAWEGSSRVRFFVADLNFLTDGRVVLNRIERVRPTLVTSFAACS